VEGQQRQAVVDEPVAPESIEMERLNRVKHLIGELDIEELGRRIEVTEGREAKYPDCPILERCGTYGRPD
jgi:hypothetical protein